VTEALILVIGASGFVGGGLARTLVADGYAVRCLTRTPARVEALRALGCDIAEGDVSKPASLDRALEGVRAVYISIQTLSPQPASRPDQRFMAVEREGLENIVRAAKAKGVRRLIYVTSLGIDAGSPSEWLRERWRAEQDLLDSGLEVTVIRPGMIVGEGGRGFGILASQARKGVVVSLASRSRMRTIALGDLVYYLVSVLDEPRAFGQRFDVGSDDVLSNRQMIDINADLVNRSHPIKIGIPLSLIGLLAPVIERLAKAPKGGIRGFLDSLDGDGAGDPMPIRALLPRPLKSYREAAAPILARAGAGPL